MTKKEIERLLRKWSRSATFEKKMAASAVGIDTRCRSFGAWLAYRACANDLRKVTRKL